MNWYYVEGGQQSGPVDETQMGELARSGRIHRETLVWREGMANWRPYGEVGGELGSGTMAAPPVAVATLSSANEGVCSQCGRIFNVQDMISYGGALVCAGCKPLFLQKLSEGVQVSMGGFHYAGFWIRVAAKLIDGLILGVVFLVPFFFLIFQAARAGAAGPSGPSMQLQIMQLLLQLVLLVANMGYTIFFLGKYGATPGKMACKIHVVTAEGGKITYLRATGRFFAEMLSGITCYIGYIIAGFDSQKRALHDHICNTRVVYKQ